MERITIGHLTRLEQLYNSGRLHTDFQQQEVINFVKWIHQQYGYAYAEPSAVHQNTPEKLAARSTT